MKLVSNGFEYRIETTKAELWYDETLNPIAKKVSKELYQSRIDSISNGAKLTFTNIETKDFYYAFTNVGELANNLTVSLDTNKKIRREFVKWKLYETLRNHFIIDLNKYGSDLTLYRKNRTSQWAQWDSYTTYNLIIRDWQIFLSIGSRNTLISKQALPNQEFNGQPAYYVLHDDHIFHKKTVDPGNYRCIASKEIRLANRFISTPKRPDYAEYYKEIESIYKEIVNYEYAGISLLKDGFARLETNKHYFQVAREYNVMLFKDGHTNVSVTNGLKNTGPLETNTSTLRNLEFVFIYPSREKARDLFQYFRNGLTQYYQGLERFIQIPVSTPDQRTILKYDYNDFDKLPKLVNDHLQKLKQDLPDKRFFAIVLLAKTKRDLGDTEPEYFELKRTLLEHGIPSQFVDEKAIGTNNFVYWLPNISIAIHAKLGGVPWRLNRPSENELVVGFGDASQSEERFVGSTVFFDNSGRLKGSNFFGANNVPDFIRNLKEAILNYLKTWQRNPERLVIHYYKLPGSQERDAVSRAMSDLGLSIPFVIVSIFDSKAKDYMAFDESYGYGMPMSGIAWKLGKDEYLLFNNTRYEEAPRTGKTTKQEYPIKLRITFSNPKHWSEETIKKIIGQVFEFSRIYWKSTQQQSKPVTALYSEMIAEFGLHFGEQGIPRNELTETTPWFI